MRRHRIHPSEFMDYAPDRQGEQVRINHEQCPAGEDTRRRMYVKRSDEELDTVVAYCHNCGGVGVSKCGTAAISSWRDRVLSSDLLRREQGGAQGSPRGSGWAEVSASAAQGAGPHDKGVEEVLLPRDAEFSRTCWPKEGRVFLSRYGLTEEYPGEVFYSSSRQRIGIVIYDCDGNRERVIYRRIFAGDTAPKYMQERSRSAGQRRTMSVGSDVLVLTEDWVSSKKINRSGYDAFPLLTTSLKPEDLVHLTDEYSRVIVWLDNDNPVVKKNRDTIVNNISLLVSNVYCVSDLSDPKNYSVTKLKEVINNVISDD